MIRWRAPYLSKILRTVWWRAPYLSKTLRMVRWRAHPDSVVHYVHSPKGLCPYGGRLRRPVTPKARGQSPRTPFRIGKEVKNLARPPRFERGTNGFVDRYSIQLSYGRIFYSAKWRIMPNERGTTKSALLDF